MKRLESFLQNRSRRHKLLVPYVTAGYPDERRFRDLIPALEQAGADAIEIGLPFSDPLADGPVIQRASGIAIANGVTTGRALELAAQVRSQVDIPLVAMGYVNPLLSYGMERFLQDSEQAGISGLILPDLPLDGDPSTEQLITASGIARIQLVTPASGNTRIVRLARAAEGFLYLVSRLGVTGGQLQSNAALPGIIETLRANCRLPVLTGFGITDGESAARAAQQCDGVIIGSALIERLDNVATAVDDAAEFLAGIRRGLDRSGADSPDAVEQEA